MHLTENWGSAMDSGNLTAAKDWLIQDLQTAASAAKGRYYVMQANPNNAESLMYEAMNTGLGPQSNLRFLETFLLELGSLVIRTTRNEPQIRINVIDTDFLSISQPYQTCMLLMGLSSSLPENPDTLSTWLIRLSMVVFTAALLIWACRTYHKPTGYQRHSPRN